MTFFTSLVAFQCIYSIRFPHVDGVVGADSLSKEKAKQSSWFLGQVPSDTQSMLQHPHLGAAFYESEEADDPHRRDHEEGKGINHTQNKTGGWIVNTSPKRLSYFTSPSLAKKRICKHYAMSVGLEGSGEKQVLQKIKQGIRMSKQFLLKQEKQHGLMLSSATGNLMTNENDQNVSINLSKNSSEFISFIAMV